MSTYVALYCRVSVDKRGRRETVEMQEKWGRDYALEHWPTLPVKVFVDNDISAAGDDDRPGLDGFRAAVERGEVAHVWAVEQSRLSRTVDGGMSWFSVAADLVAANISELHTRHNGIVRVGEVVAAITAVLNADEIKRLRQRVNAKLDDLAAEGRPSGSVVFGYRHVVEDGRKALEIIPEQAAIVREIADRVLGGWSLAAICRNLVGRGVKGAHGGQLTPSGIRKIVTNPTAAGFRVHRRQTVGRGNWEPILDEATWTAVRAKLAAPRVVACSRTDGTDGTHPIGAAALSSYTARRYLLTGGLAVCGTCGAALVGTVKQGRKGEESKPYLLCVKGRGPVGREGQGCGGILLLPTEDYVRDQLLAALDRPDFLADLATDDGAARRAELLVELAALDARRTELGQQWASGAVDTVSWNAARGGLDAQERTLRGALAAVPAPPPVLGLGDVRAAWPGLTLDERREIIRLLVARVVIGRATPGTRAFDSNRVDIEWR